MAHGGFGRSTGGVYFSYAPDPTSRMSSRPCLSTHNFAFHIGVAGLITAHYLEHFKRWCMRLDYKGLAVMESINRLHIQKLFQQMLFYKTVCTQEFLCTLFVCWQNMTQHHLFPSCTYHLKIILCYKNKQIFCDAFWNVKCRMHVCVVWTFVIK